MVGNADVRAGTGSCGEKLVTIIVQNHKTLLYFNSSCCSIHV